jgi:regulator of sigma E protease
MSIFIAILGLALLILVHEAGHFFGSLAVGLRPRKFYVGFPPALLKWQRNGIEYGFGAIPLGGFVTIPGMHRPIPHDADRRFAHAAEEAPGLVGPIDRVKRTLEASELVAGLAALDDLEHALRETKLSPRARASAEKGLTELRDALGPQAYWKAPTWKRLVAIMAGPGANIVLTVVLFAILFTTVGGKPSQTIASVAADSPAEEAGLLAGDKVIAVDGDRVSGEGLGERILGSEGRPLVLTVIRDGDEVKVGPLTPTEIDGVYRIGIVREGVGLPPVDASWRAVEVTGIVTKEIVLSIGRLVTGQGREDVASPIGITRVSSDAVEEGAANYLWVLGLISLSIGLMNLLPLLPLDGGHVLFAVLEGARGRVLRREVYERASAVGIAVVVLLFVIGLTNDIGRLS